MDAFTTAFASGTPLIFTWTDGARVSVRCADMTDAIETARATMRQNAVHMAGSRIRISTSGDRLICAVPRDSAEPIKLAYCLNWANIGGTGGA